MFWLGLILGTFIGASFGLAMSAILFAKSEAFLQEKLSHELNPIKNACNCLLTQNSNKAGISPD
jgi:hypothetical protein